MNTEPNNIEMNVPVALAVLALRNGGSLTIKGIDEYANEDIQIELEQDGSTLTIKARIATEPEWLYQPPFGSPIHWTDQNKVVQHAVIAYLEHRMKGKEITQEQTELTIRYMQYYVNAPAWIWSTSPKALEQLQEAAQAARTTDDIERLDTLCKQTGLQPIN